MPQDIVRSISRGDYPMYVPDILVRKVFVRIKRSKEQGCVGWDNVNFAVNEQSSAALCAIEYLRIREALCSDNVILTMLLTHVQKKQRKLLFTAQDRVITEEQNIFPPYSYCYIFIISFIDGKVNTIYNYCNNIQRKERS